jgi:hypothetical protein
VGGLTASCGLLGSLLAIPRGSRRLLCLHPCEQPLLKEVDPEQTSYVGNGPSFSTTGSSVRALRYRSVWRIRVYYNSISTDHFILRTSLLLSFGLATGLILCLLSDKPATPSDGSRAAIVGRTPCGRASEC